MLVVQELGLDELDQAEARAVTAECLADVGLVVIRNTTREHFEHVFDEIATRRVHRDSDGSGVTVIAPTVDDDQTAGTGYDGFTHKALPLHTDGSATAEPPGLLAMFCEEQSSEGGQATVSDGLTAVERLALQFPDSFEALRAGQFAFGLDRSYCGPVLERLGAGWYALRFRDDGLASFDAATDAIERFRAIATAQTITIPLAANDGYILQNGRWLHGRRSFVGSRKMLRINGDPKVSAAHVIRYGFPWSDVMYPASQFAESA